MTITTTISIVTITIGFLDVLQVSIESLGFKVIITFITTMVLLLLLLVAWMFFRSLLRCRIAVGSTHFASW